MPENDIQWNELMQAANASPLEVLSYYLAYPEQLTKDAIDRNYLPINYLMQVYQSALEYYNQKFT